MYAANNPVNNSDPSGNGIIKNSIKWIAKNIVKPVVKKVIKVLSKVNATYSKGVNISVSTSVFSFNFQCGITYDTKGHVAYQGNFSGGVTTGSPSISLTKYKTFTNAPLAKKLEGPGYQMGGSVGVPIYSYASIVAGSDFNIIPDEELKTTYYGITNTRGIDTSGREIHAEWGETVPLIDKQINIYNIAEGIYIKIME